MGAAAGAAAVAREREQTESAHARTHARRRRTEKEGEMQLSSRHGRKEGGRNSPGKLPLSLGISLSLSVRRPRVFPHPLLLLSSSRTLPSSMRALSSVQDTYALALSQTLDEGREGKAEERVGGICSAISSSATDDATPTMTTTFLFSLCDFVHSDCTLALSGADEAALISTEGLHFSFACKFTMRISQLSSQI